MRAVEAVRVRLGAGVAELVDLGQPPRPLGCEAAARRGGSTPASPARVARRSTSGVSTWPRRLRRRFPGPRWLDGSRCPAHRGDGFVACDLRAVVTRAQLARSRPSGARSCRSRRSWPRRPWSPWPRRRWSADRRSGDGGRQRRPRSRCSATSSPSPTSASSTPRTSYGALAAARDAGGVGTRRSGRHDRHDRASPRAGSIVQQAPSGFRLPMSVTALAPVGDRGRQRPRHLGRRSTPTSVVMGERTAGLRGAQAGDLIDLVAADGGVHTLTISRIGTEDEVGGTELLMTTEAAGRLGITTDTQVVICGFPSASALDAALADRGRDRSLPARGSATAGTRRAPTATSGSARTKELLGEFAYQILGDGSIVQEAGVAGGEPAGRSRAPQLADPDPGALPQPDRRRPPGGARRGRRGRSRRRHRRRPTPTPTAAAHYPRFNRIGGELGFLSRHSWAMALDTNTVSNCQGCVPQMNCEVVRIFRRHNFAWGGNFLRARRDALRVGRRAARPDRATRRPTARTSVQATTRGRRGRRLAVGAVRDRRTCDGPRPLSMRRSLSA